MIDRARLCVVLAGLALGCGTLRGADKAPVAKVVLPAAKPEAKVQFEDGLRLMHEGPRSWERARAAFARATDLDSKLYEAWHNRGIVDLRMGKLDDARDELERAFDIQPGSRATLVALCEVLRRLDRHTEAQKLLRKRLDVMPDDVELRLRYIQALREGGKSQDALDEVRVILAKDSKSAVAFNALGLVYLKMEKPALAESALRRAAELDPKNASVHNNLGLVALAQGRDQEAFAEFQKAADLDPKDAEARLNKAVVFMDCGDYKKAMVDLAKAAEISPTDPDVHVALGVAARGLKDFARARKAYERALDLRPDYAPALFNLAVLYMDFEPDKNKARENLILFRKVAAANDPRRPDALARLKELK